MEIQRCKNHFTLKGESPNLFGTARRTGSFGSHSDTVGSLTNSSPPSPTLQNSSNLNDESLLNDSAIQLTHSYRGKVKAQDVYGGPLMFGGSSSARRSRLLAQSPYSRTSSHRHSWLNKGSSNTTATANAPVSSISHLPKPIAEENMSLSAKSILDVLKNISGLPEGAQGYVPRSESRQTSSDLSSVLAPPAHDFTQMPNLKRRRPDLSSSKVSNSPNMRALLRGPPVRKLMSPVAAPLRSRKNIDNIKERNIDLRFSSSSVLPESTLLRLPEKNLGLLSSSIKTVPSVPPISTNGSEKWSATNEVSVERFNFSSTTVSKESEDSGLQGTPFPKKNGKVRTRIGKVSKEMEVLPSPISPHLANPPTLALRGIPNFDTGLFQTIPAKSSSPQKLTSGNIPDSKTSALETDSSRDGPISLPTSETTRISPVKKATMNYKFSLPVIVTESSEPKVVGLNGATTQFTFTSPLIISSLPSLNTEITTQLPPMTCTQMPDLTSGPAFSANHRCNDLFKAARSLKKGSVMDILGGGHKLPDVTGVDNFNEPRNTWGSKNWT